MELTQYNIDPSDPVCLERIDTSPGALALCAEHGRCLLVAVTGNVREFCKKRLSPERKSPLADIVASIECIRCESLFEAQAAYLKLVQRHLDDARSIVDRMRCWFLRLDRVNCTWDLTQLDQGWDCDERYTIVGPMPDKHTAERLGQLLDAGFDLCRYPTELRRTPHGRACVYHEMGRCPAPCDGTEPWPTFAARFAQAARDLQSHETLVLSLESRMTCAAAVHEFERAREIQTLIERLRSRRGQAFKHIATITHGEYIVITPAESTRSRIWSWRPTGLDLICELHRNAANPELIQLAHQIKNRPLPPVRKLTQQDIELFWVLGQRLFLARRAEQFLHPEAASNPKNLKSALNRRPKITHEDDHFTLL